MAQNVRCFLDIAKQSLNDISDFFNRPRERGTAL